MGAGEGDGGQAGEGAGSEMGGALEVCPDFGLPPKNHWRRLRVPSTDEAVRLLFVSPLSQEDGRMRQGEQRGAAAGVQAGGLSLGQPGSPETGPGGHREGCSGGSLVNVWQGWQGEGLGIKEDLQGPAAPRARCVDTSPRGPGLPRRGANPRAPTCWRTAWQAAEGQTSMAMAADGSTLASAEPPSLARGALTATRTAYLPPE